MTRAARGRRVFLHVGLPKTGTTFIQTTMWHNRALMRRRGLLYPGRRRMDHYHASQEVRGTPAARMGSHAGTWDRLRAEVAAFDGDAIITHEFFCMATPEQARAAVEALTGDGADGAGGPVEVHVVVTARDYVRQFPAVWQEALKMHSDLSFDAFMDKAFDRTLKGAWGWESQDLPAVLERWSAAVPPERLHLVTVPAPGAPRELLWQRWCAVVGLDDDGFDTDVTYANESLGAAQARLLWHVKPHVSGPLRKGPVRHRWVRAYLGHEVLVPQKGARFAPRPEQAARLRELALEAVAAVEAGGYDVVGDLADLVPAVPEGPDAAPWPPHPDDVSDGETLEVAARAIEQMVRDVRRLTEERDRLRKRLQRRRGLGRGLGGGAGARGRVAGLARRVRSAVRR